MTDYDAPPPPATGYPQYLPQQPRYVPAPRPLLRSVYGLGIALQIMLVAFFLVAGALFVAVLREGSLLDRVAADYRSVSVTQLISADNLISAASVATGLLYLAIGVVWIVWIYRARQNVEAWNPHAALLRPGWAIGVWFIPLAGLVGGPMIVNGIVEVTDEYPDGRDTGRGGRATVIAWAIGWVALSVATLVARGESVGLDDAGATIDDVVSYSDIRTVCVAIIAAAAIPAVALVRRLTNHQTERILAGRATSPAA